MDKKTRKQTFWGNNIKNTSDQRNRDVQSEA